MLENGKFMGAMLQISLVILPKLLPPLRMADFELQSKHSQHEALC